MRRLLKDADSIADRSERRARILSRSLPRCDSTSVVDVGAMKSRDLGKWQCEVPRFAVTDRVVALWGPFRSFFAVL